MPRGAERWRPWQGVRPGGVAEPNANAPTPPPPNSVQTRHPAQASRAGWQNGRGGPKGRGGYAFAVFLVGAASWTAPSPDAPSGRGVYGAPSSGNCLMNASWTGWPVPAATGEVSWM